MYISEIGNKSFLVFSSSESDERSFNLRFRRVRACKKNKKGGSKEQNQKKKCLGPQRRTEWGGIKINLCNYSEEILSRAMRKKESRSNSENG